MSLCLDTPAANALCDPDRFQVEGWIVDDERRAEINAVELWLDNRAVARTEITFVREDVSAALGLPATLRTGFRLWARPPAGSFGTKATFSLKAYAGGLIVQTYTFTVTFTDSTRSASSAVFVRPEEILKIVSRTLGPPPLRLLDLHCGLGHYGRSLLQAGYAWYGAEADASNCLAMANFGMPHSRLQGTELPFVDASFDVALTVGGLARIAGIPSLFAEIRRVAPYCLIAVEPRAESTDTLMSRVRDAYPHLEMFLFGHGMFAIARAGPSRTNNL